MKEIDQFTGCIIGLACGDALGRPTEFIKSVPTIYSRFGGPVTRFVKGDDAHEANCYTDDTQMTIAVTRALIRNGHGTLDELMHVMSEEFIAWARSPLNNRAPGGTCLSGCANLKRGKHWKEAGIPTSKGCGAAMRAAPIGLYYSDDRDRMVLVAAAQSSLTHRHPTAIASSVASAAAVAHLVRSRGSLQGLTEFVLDCLNVLDEHLLVEVGCPPDTARLIGTSEMLASMSQQETALHGETDDVCSLLGEAWVGEEAVACALWCVLKEYGIFEGSIIRGANSSGDSDSIACIAGSIAGALVGIDHIPKHFALKVEDSDRLYLLADALYASKHRGETAMFPSLDFFGVTAK
jgi:ADP-ribosylglycohydrolase